MRTPGGAKSVASWLEEWLVGRRARVKDATNDEQRLRTHVLPVRLSENSTLTVSDLLLTEVEPSHLVRVMEECDKAGLAPRTKRNVYSVMKAMFRDARIAIPGLFRMPDPCILTFRQYGSAEDKDPGWRPTARFTAEELAALIHDPRIPMDRRVQYALMSVGFLRDGEMAGLRWERILRDRPPLHGMHIMASYQDRTKTRVERIVPIHRVLEALLDEWRATGWPAMIGCAPAPADLVLPCPAPTNRGPRKPLGAMRDKNYIWKRITKDLTTLGLRHRRAHDLRRSGISLAQDCGADRNVLTWATHAPPKDVMGLYTSLAWATLCTEVSKLMLPDATRNRSSEALPKP
jgi:integrase